MAATGVPSSPFAPALVLAYPYAKVIINKRDDIDAWYQSILNTFENPKRQIFSKWSLALFDAEMFWLKLARDAVWGYPVGYDFAANGKELCRRHYAEFEDAAMRPRQVLRWKVEDG